MRLVVMDPRLIIRAFARPQGDPARLFALFAFGRVCEVARGYSHDERTELEAFAREHDADIDVEDEEALRERASQDEKEAERRVELMDEAFEMLLPRDLLLVTSPPLLDELAGLAQDFQTRGYSHLQPDVVIRAANAHAWISLTSLDPASFYLGADEVYEREYLIHTATTAGADYLITPDSRLQLPGDATHRDPRTGQTVRPYSVDEFVDDELPYNFALRDVDARAVMRAAVKPLGRQTARRPVESENRRFVRVPADRPAFITADGGRRLETQTIDLSLGGMLLGRTPELEEDERLVFALDLGSATVSGEGRIIREYADGRRAVRIQRMATGDDQVLARFVAEYQFAE